MNPDYIEFNASADIANVSFCLTLVIPGCTDMNSINYNSLSTVDNYSCIPFIFGCTDPNALNFNSNANSENYSCELPLYGCTDLSAQNFNPLANSDDGSCVESPVGCTDPLAYNYNPDAIVESVYFVNPIPTDQNMTILIMANSPMYGHENITQIGVFAQNNGVLSCFGLSNLSDANDSGSFQITVWGDDLGSDEIDGMIQDQELVWRAIDSDDIQYSVDVDYDFLNPSGISSATYTQNGVLLINGLSFSNYNGECIEYEDLIVGCMIEDYVEFNEFTDIANSEYCINLAIPGCIDVNAFNYNSLATVSDSSCISIINGCLDPLALNYNPEANIENYSCVDVVSGCTDELAINYNSYANTDDSFCIQVVMGCMDLSASNYNSQANTDYNSCTYPSEGCTNNQYLEFDSLAEFSDGSCENLIFFGCMNPLFLEFDPYANLSNDSCLDIKVEGCTSSIADNYNPLANYDNGSCSFDEYTLQLYQINDSVIALNDMLLDCSSNTTAIYLDLLEGWNIIGYTLTESQNVVETLSSIISSVKIIKNNLGEFYWPELSSYNQIGDFIPGQGYQIKMINSEMNYTIPIID
jgi:hypothetical protein